MRSPISMLTTRRFGARLARRRGLGRPSDTPLRPTSTGNLDLTLQGLDGPAVPGLVLAAGVAFRFQEYFQHPDLALQMGDTSLRPEVDRRAGGCARPRDGILSLGRRIRRCRARTRRQARQVEKRWACAA